MKTLLAALLAFSLSAAALAGETPPPITMFMKYKGTTVRLFDLPCTNDFVMVNVDQKFLPSLRLAEANFEYNDGRPNEMHGGCWIVQDDLVLSLWDDGDTLEIPIKMFAREGI